MCMVSKEALLLSLPHLTPAALSIGLFSGKKVNHAVRLAVDIMNFQLFFFFFSAARKFKYFMKFCTAGKGFSWLPNSVIIILYSKCILDFATGHAVFFSLSAAVAKVNFILQITSFVLGLLLLFLEKFTFFKSM